MRSVATAGGCQPAPYRPRSRIRAATAGGTRPSSSSPAAIRARRSREAIGLGSRSRKRTLSGRARPSRTRWNRSRGNPGRVATASRVRSRTSSGSAPAGEVAELVGADHEDRIVEALRPEQLDRPRVRIEADVVAGERRPGELEPRRGGRVHAAVSGPLHHEHDEPLDGEALARCRGDRNVPEVRWIERAAVEDGHSHSSTSSPISTSWPSRAPAARRIASSSSSGGGVPVTRKPRSVRKTWKPRRCGCGR